MFCIYCGAKLAEEAAFCHTCGKAINRPPVQPVSQTPVEPVQPVAAPVESQPPVESVAAPVEPAQPVPVAPVAPAPVAQPTPVVRPQPVADTSKQDKLQNQSLVFGILSLSLSLLGIPGIVFAGIAGKQAGKLKKLTGRLTGKARTGYGLAKAGRIVGIIMTVVWAILLTNGLTDLIESFGGSGSEEFIF